MTTDEFRKHAHELVEWIAGYFENIENYPVKSQVKPGEIFNRIPGKAPSDPEPFKKIFSDSYAKLKAGGKLVVAYKDKDSHRPIALNWYGDWYFIPRNEDELLTLINASMGAENISISIEREDSGVIFFAIITKIK